MTIDTKKDIYRKIQEVASIEFQKKLWLNQNNDTGLISSYVELMCTLFDDFAFEEFLGKIVEEKTFSETLINELKLLQNMLDKYEEKNTDEEIIKDPEWLKVVNQASKVIQVWDKEIL